MGRSAINLTILQHNVAHQQEQMDIKAIQDGNEEVFLAEDSPVGLNNSQMVIFQQESGCYLRLQGDTGTQSNVLPVMLYKKATRL